MKGLRSNQAAIEAYEKEMWNSGHDFHLQTLDPTRRHVSDMYLLAEWEDERTPPSPPSPSSTMAIVQRLVGWSGTLEEAARYLDMVRPESSHNAGAQRTETP